ncbi:hypothetical protein ANO11243_094190 [Dothideomycetidae sp. 11243]|nr:hypothetical protein ANO11243_094190 [fungal sp. No.11243]
MAAQQNELMLVTGGSGFVALHCIAQALAAGYRVRTTVRSTSKQSNVLKGLEKAQPPVNSKNLEFAVADLMKDEGWDKALAGVSLVLHVASPFPAVQPKDENALIRPAVDGTLRVLKAAKSAGSVRRVVVTSSAAAIGYGTAYQPGKVYTEADWSDPEGRSGHITPYEKSKTLAERAAWDFIKREGGEMQLTTVNPVGVFGPPLLWPCESTTCDVINQMLTGKLPGYPDLTLGVVDVRDVASLHLMAATKPEASGQRYLAVAGKSLSLADMGAVLRKDLPEHAGRVPTRNLPTFLVKIMSYLMPQLRDIAPQLGQKKDYSNDKAKSLGWKPKSADEAIASCGQALVDAGVLR